MRTLALLTIIGCLLGAGVAQARTLAEIRSTGELRLCVAGSSAPFYQANGAEFARYLGVRAKTETLPSWDAQFVNTQGVVAREGRYEAAPLATGRCDLYPNDLHIMPWREKKMVLVPYYSTRNVVVSRRDMRPTLRSEADLGGYTAAVQAGTAYEGWLRAFNQQAGAQSLVVIRLAETAQAMRDVAERRADFTVIAAESAFKWVRDDLDNLDLLFPVGEVTQVGWGIATHSRELEQALQAFFAESRRVGSALDASWRKKYDVSLMEYQLFSASLGGGQRWRELLTTWGIPMGSALAGLLLAMALRARRLRREVAQHQLAVQALRESEARMRSEAARGQAIAGLLKALQLVDSLGAFGEVTLRELARHLPLGQALIALVAQDGHGLQALAHYAGGGDSPARTLDEFPTTAGLMARCAATAQAVLVESPGPDYLQIRSGLGHGAPAALLLVPVRHAGRVIAVVEMATTLPVEPQHRELLDALEPIMATEIHRLRAVAGRD